MESQLIKQFYIEYDKQWSVYEPGDTVTGTVHLELSKRVFCDQITAQVYGSARVFWVDREMTPLPLQSNDELDFAMLDDPRQKRRRPPAAVPRQVPYSQEKIYFDQRIPLWSKQNKGADNNQGGIDDLVRRSAGLRLKSVNMASTSGRPYLDPGRHKYNFSFPLPDHVPTSFDSTNAVGSVRYFVKAHISEYGQTKHSRKTLFTVVRKQDLNANPGLGCAMSKSSRQKLVAGLCSPKNVGQVSIHLNARKTGYVPGESLLVTATINNNSHKSIKGITLQLVQKVVCHALVSKTAHRVICSQAYTGEKLKKNGGSCEFSPLLYVPAITPTFEEPDVISVDYKLVLVVAKRLNERQILARLELPIVVGTVPINSNQAELPVYEKTASERPSQPPNYEVAVGVPPPSYEESVTGLSFGNEGFQNDQGDNESMRPPRYPVYELGTTSEAQ